MKQHCINFTEFSYPDVLVCIRWGTWFIAAVTGPVCGGSYPWLSFCHHISLHYLDGSPCSLQAVLYRGPCFFLECNALGSQLPFVAEKKAPVLLGWEWFYMFGLLRCMNGSEGLCVRKAAMPHHSCSEVILEDSGRWSGLFWEPERETHAQCERKTL